MSGIMTILLLPSRKNMTHKYHIQMILGIILIIANSLKTCNLSAYNCVMRYLGQGSWKKDPLQMARGRHAYSGFLKTSETSSGNWGL